MVVHSCLNSLHDLLQGDTSHSSCLQRLLIFAPFPILLLIPHSLVKDPSCWASLLSNSWLLAHQADGYNIYVYLATYSGIRNWWFLPCSQFLSLSPCVLVTVLLHNRLPLQILFRLPLGKVFSLTEAIYFCLHCLFVTIGVTDRVERWVSGLAMVLSVCLQTQRPSLPSKGAEEFLAGLGQAQHRVLAQLGHPFLKCTVTSSGSCTCLAVRSHTIRGKNCSRYLATHAHTTSGHIPVWYS